MIVLLLLLLLCYYSEYCATIAESAAYNKVVFSAQITHGHIGTVFLLQNQMLSTDTRIYARSAGTTVIKTDGTYTVRYTVNESKISLFRPRSDNAVARFAVHRELLNRYTKHIIIFLPIKNNSY